VCGQVITATIIITVMLAVVSIVLGFFAAWFNKNLGVAILHLADFVGKVLDVSTTSPNPLALFVHGT